MIVGYRKPFLWTYLPPEYKLATSLSNLKKQVKIGNEKTIHVG